MLSRLHLIPSAERGLEFSGGRAQCLTERRVVSSVACCQRRCSESPAHGPLPTRASRSVGQTPAGAIAGPKHICLLTPMDSAKAPPWGWNPCFGGCRLHLSFVDHFSNFQVFANIRGGKRISAWFALFFLLGDTRFPKKVPLSQMFCPPVPATLWASSPGVPSEDLPPSPTQTGRPLVLHSWSLLSLRLTPAICQQEHLVGSLSLGLSSCGSLYV